jgi:hypothetical protein
MHITPNHTYAHATIAAGCTIIRDLTYGNSAIVYLRLSRKFECLSSSGMKYYIPPTAINVTVRLALYCSAISKFRAATGASAFITLM